jgi:multidrug transporter EmrE-like cation transporter
VISLLPSQSETLVLPLSAKAVFAKFSSATRNDLAALQDKSIVFSGWVKQDRFRVSVKINRPNNFLALIKGRIESTSSGSLVFLEYQLFPTTRLLVTFWLLFTLLFTAIVSFQFSSSYYLFSGLAVALGIYLITWSNFKIQRNIAREILLRILE